ncbi:MAG: sugar phosphate isomerase/epimerase [Propionibacteriaceae bacterium]|jgi:sugar phosphate isomerase/epimerase|uniref:Xylose isomerase-like TIM barrel n=1 Tax=Propionibacterium ruminifibrarum TaxID=1962131 RepID=A0A375HZY7_9ACTN|nr:sugar phosphate isomerase/epimerase family protein [Propionibacterium ruminifibrarum]MBE6476928.1 sugar phosphate isomerase/epimerase [Propionibacteriaceae bacterium]SPF68101.1 Xylose isomerase-like TIM barrel [Propionibacterium ruminifibrarum]
MYTADAWPIACKMNFGPLAEDGTPIAEAPLEIWRDQLLQVAELGFKHFDPMDDWIPLADISEERFAQFQVLLDETGLACPAMSIGRNSVIDADRGDENLALVHRTIDRASALGATIVNIGFQQELTEPQKEALWFWLADGHHDDPGLYDLAVERVRELADHAQRLGLQISLEMYEDTFIGTVDGALQFHHDVDHPAVGINPDLGNLIRLHRPMPKGEEMYERLLPLSNYWHIKSYIRDEDDVTGAYMSAPVPLKYGVVNYRAVIRRAIQVGYDGPFMTEHYGSDWLGVGAENAEYIRQVLRGALRSFGRDK